MSSSDNDQDEYIYEEDNEDQDMDRDQDQDLNYYNNLMMEPGLLDINGTNLIKKITIDLCLYFNVDILTLKLNKKLEDHIVTFVHSKSELINIYYGLVGLGSSENSDDKHSGLRTIFRYMSLKKFNNNVNISDTTRLLIHELKQIFIKLNRICINCFAELPLVVSKPTICNKSLCKYSLDMYNVGINLNYEINHNRNVLELLISLFRSSLDKVNNENDETFFINYSDSIKSFLVDDLNLRTVTDRKQYMKKILNFKDLVDILNNNELSKIVKWIISSNPAIVIEISDKFEEIACNKYILQTGSIDKEATFQMLKKKYGSFYTFSGSPYGNWHSILRTGLQVLSNTSRMTAGAVYGSGIYSSYSLEVAKTYAAHSYGHGSSSIVAMCEIINDPNKYTNVADREICVIKDARYITTRFLFEFRNMTTRISEPGISSRTLVRPEYNYQDLGPPIYTDYQRPIDQLDQDRCSICQIPFSEDPNNIVSLVNCHHKFHKECIDQLLEQNINKCPECNQFFRENYGSGPEGTMTVTRSSERIPGYQDCGSLIITYNIPSGQIDNVDYAGITRTAYLPDNKKGQYVLTLLKEAFDKRLIFRIGESLTTGQQNVVTWGTIHHKTSINGPHGYPDPEYLDRVIDELKQVGLGLDRPFDDLDRSSVRSIRAFGLRSKKKKRSRSKKSSKKRSKRKLK